MLLVSLSPPSRVEPSGRRGVARERPRLGLLPPPYQVSHDWHPGAAAVSASPRRRRPHTVFRYRVGLVPVVSIVVGIVVAAI